MGQTVSPFIHAGGRLKSIYLLSCSASCPTKDVKICSAAAAELSYFPVFIHTCRAAADDDEYLSLLALSADDLSEIPPGT